MDQSPILNGSISASWFLAAVVSIMCLLLWNMLRTMQREIKENAEKINENTTQLQVHEQRLEGHDEDFKRISHDNKNLVDEITTKIKFIIQEKQN